jgi:hypothetical protein
MPTFLPTEEEINQLIGGLGPKLAAYMMTVKDTYARAGEIFNLKVRKDRVLSRHVWGERPNPSQS